MKPVARTTVRPAVFVQQLHRAAVQRGRLDPVYQDLSDHWTQVLQRLYPVWALIGPGLSDPGHIEIHSRTVYLDSESLLGSRAPIAAGALEQRAILRCFGVALHETLHAKHTKRWAIEHDIELSESDDPAERQLAVDRRLLEEPRMEAHGVREFPPDSLRGRFVRRALQVAVIDVILPAFAEQVLAAAVAGVPLSRDLAARASVYLQARTHYGILELASLAPLRDVWLAVLGERDLEALDDLYAKVIWIPNGELERLNEAAREYRRIVGQPDPPPTAGEPAGSGEGEREADSGEGDCTDCGGAPGAGSLADALEQSIASARAGQLEQLDEDVDVQQVLETRSPPAHVRASLAARGGQGSRAAGCPTAAWTGRRSRTRCSKPAATPTGYARRSPTERGESTSAPPAGPSTGARTHAAAPSRPPAIPGRSSAVGAASACSRGWPSGDRATGGCRRPTTSRAATRVGVGETRSDASPKESGLRRVSSHACSAREAPPARLARCGLRR
jgi:hypothetical protein